MTNKQREKAIAEFKDIPERQILVASLKCGGLGLNLTMASRIICIDLWFNSFVEQQGQLSSAIRRYGVDLSDG